MQAEVSYPVFENLLARANCVSSAAEIHGIACGLLAINVNADNELWFRQIFPDRDPQDVLQNELAAELDKTLKGVRLQIQEGGFDFSLMLPDDDEALEDRVDAMQEWTQGFLLGVSLAGLQDFSDLPDDSRELLMDFVEIGKQIRFDLEDEEESETALFEIIEYLRMGVLVIVEELQPIQNTSQTLH